jgi:hypothetical protein
VEVYSVPLQVTAWLTFEDSNINAKVYHKYPPRCHITAFIGFWDLEFKAI